MVKKANMTKRLARSHGPGKLRKDPSLSQDELNKRAEAFINKFKVDMRLQRKESLNSSIFLDSQSKGLTTLYVRSNPKARLNISTKFNKQTLAASSTPFFNSSALRKSFTSLFVSSRSSRSLVVKASELPLVGNVAPDFEAEAVFNQEFINNEELRSRWDLVSHGGQLQQMVCIAKGQDSGNRISLSCANVKLSDYKQNDASFCGRYWGGLILVPVNRYESSSLRVEKTMSSNGIGNLNTRT
ncbi:hypothetical protein AgCh_029392 [Apium graveolens]